MSERPMSEQRFVLVAWPETAGPDAENANARESFAKLLAASPVAADDPAMVERVASVLCIRLESGQPMCDATCPDCRDDAVRVLRLFSPPKE